MVSTGPVIFEPFQAHLLYPHPATTENSPSWLCQQFKEKAIWCTAYCSRIIALCSQQDNVILRTIQDLHAMMFSSSDIQSWFNYRVNIVKGMQEHILLHSYSHLVADDVEMII